MIKKIDSRKAHSDHRPKYSDSKKPILSPTRRSAIAALGLLTVVVGASQIDLDSSDRSTDTPPAVSSYEKVPGLVEPIVSVLEPGSPEAVAEAQRIADITNPDELVRQASIDEANRLTGFQP